MRRRLFLTGMAGAAAVIGATGAFRRPSISASSDVQNSTGQILICGFEGRDATSRSAQLLAKQIRDGRAGGVIFVKDNIGSKNDVLGLTALFSDNAPQKPILAIDHEGGAVQRLVAAHGCTPLPSAKTMAQDYSIDQARNLYEEAGHALARLGFNLNLAPVVDLDDPQNPAVGHFGRAFSADPEIVTSYARTLIAGFAAAGILCSLKHFPGQGGARYDPHLALRDDVSSSRSDRDLSPFRELIRDKSAVMVMSGHLIYDHQPAVLSRTVVTDILRGTLGFEGVALTDDLDMGLAGYGFERPSIARKALKAGNDLFIIRNRRNYDQDLPASFAAWIAESLADGDITMDDLKASVARVRNLRKTISI